MFVIAVYRWVCGYVLFRARGGFLERFLNLCAANGITVWGAKIKGGVLYGKMSCKDYKRIRRYARAAKTRPHIHARKGLICIFARYKNRWGLLAGAMAFFVILNVMSGFIWNINISGNDKVDGKTILSQLEKSGVYEGVWRKNADTDKAAQQLLIDMPQLSWCAINTDGCFATVEVRETSEREMEQKTSYPANIVAARGGTIVSIRAYYGVPTVQTGEAVAKGDMLVSGIMDTNTGGVIYCEARAEVIAQTVRILSVTVPFLQERYENISEPFERRILCIFGSEIPLYFGKVTEPYSVKREVIVPTVKDKRLPLKIYSAAFVKQRKVQYKIDEVQAKQKAQKEMEQLCKAELGDIVVSQQSAQFSADKNGVTLSAEYLCEEDIASPKKILIIN